MNVFQKLNYKYSIFGLWLYSKNVFFVFPTHINCFYKTTCRAILKLHCKYRIVGRISELLVEYQNQMFWDVNPVSTKEVHIGILVLKKSHSTACRTAVCNNYIIESFSIILLLSSVTYRCSTVFSFRKLIREFGLKFNTL